MDETRERFLRLIVARVPLERLVELHLFPPMRQGVLETGMAVIAARPEPVVEALEVEVPVSEVPVSEAPVSEAPVSEEGYAAEAPAAEAPVLDPHATVPSSHPDRLVVYTARYRWTRKGPDRGKWESEVVAEADAPLVTVEAVVRGVRERTAEAGDPERMSGDDVAAALAAVESWATTAP